jgi:hypothetical protein
MRGTLHALHWCSYASPTTWRTCVSFDVWQKSSLSFFCEIVRRPQSVDICDILVGYISTPYLPPLRPAEEQFVSAVIHVRNPAHSLLKLKNLLLSAWTALCFCRHPHQLLRNIFKAVLVLNALCFFKQIKILAVHVCSYGEKSSCLRMSLAQKYGKFFGIWLL